MNEIDPFRWKLKIKKNRIKTSECLLLLKVFSSLQMTIYEK